MHEIWKTDLKKAAFASSSVNKGVTGDETKPTTAVVRWLLSLTVHLLSVLHAWLLNVQIILYCCLLFGIVDDEDHSLTTKIRSLVQPRPCGPLPGLGSTLGGASDPRPDWLGFVVRPGRLQVVRCCSCSFPPVLSNNSWRQSVHVCACDRHVLCAASCGQCRACQRRMLLLDQFGRLKRRLFHYRIV
ncbi:Carboxypeptidase [Trichinella pseudospiralis]